MECNNISISKLQRLHHEVWESISNFIPHYLVDVITYTSMLVQLIPVSKRLSKLLPNWRLSCDSITCCKLKQFPCSYNCCPWQINEDQIKSCYFKDTVIYGFKCVYLTKKYQNTDDTPTLFFFDNTKFIHHDHLRRYHHHHHHDHHRRRHSDLHFYPN